MTADADLVVEPPKPIIIKYDGLDASGHVMDMGDLAVSLKGLNRIVSVAGTFAVEQRLVRHKDAMPLRVVVGPPEAKCVLLQAALVWVDQHQTISGIASGLAVSLIGYIFNKAAGNREEMKHLKDLATEAIRQLGNRDEAVIARLLDTVDKMADTLRPAVRDAVKPIGSSASTLQIAGANGHGPSVTIDKPTRDAICAEDPVEVGDERIIRVRFMEMNLDTKACRIALEDGGDERFVGEITDPTILAANNPYAVAFAAKTVLAVRARPTLKAGEVDRWYISAAM